jgi:hypothetical protein
MNGSLQRSVVWWLAVFLLAVMGVASGEIDTTAYLFSRNATSLELNFIGTRISPLGDFNATNTVCAQQTTFVLPGNPLHNFQVIGLQEVFMQGNALFAKVPAKAEFLVYDEPTQNWYLWYNGSLGPLVNASVYQEEMPGMSSVCYISGDMIPFIPLPDEDILKRMSLIIFVAACFAALFALLGVVVNLRWIWKAQAIRSKTTALFSFVALLAVASLAFAAVAVAGGYFADSRLITGFSTIANWTAMLLILFIMAILLISDALALEEQDKASLTSHVLPSLVIFGLIFIAIPVMVFVPLRYILGPDDTSKYTLHFFVGTLIGEPAVIDYHIEMM